MCTMESYPSLRLLIQEKNMDGLQIILLNERFQTTKEYILNGSTYIKLENTNLTECRSVPAFESGSGIWEQV